MNEFRVYDIENQEMLYEGFFLDQEGKLYKNNQENGMLEHCEQENYIIMHSLNRYDIANQEIFNYDILRYETGYEFVVVFGKYPAFCPGDNVLETNQGFTAIELKGSKLDIEYTYPLSDTELYSKVVGYYVNNKATYLPEDENVVIIDEIE